MANENLFCPLCKKEFERIYDLYVHCVSPEKPENEETKPGHYVNHGTAVNMISSLISRFCWDKYNNVIQPEKKSVFRSYDKTKI